MLRAAPSVMDSAALFRLVARCVLFLAWSFHYEYVITHGIAQPCGGNKVRVPFEYLDGPNRKAC